MKNRIKMYWNRFILKFFITKNLNDCLINISDSYYYNKLYYEDRKIKDKIIKNKRLKKSIKKQEHKNLRKIEIILK